MLFMPIVVPFYESNGLSMQDIFILRAIYSISIVLMEIPSGYLADVFGRKKNLIYGVVLGFTGFMTYSFSGGFTGFLIAEIILGVGQSLISGADSAMLYDSLAQVKKEDEYLKYEGRMVSYGNFAEAIAGIVGGFIAAIHLRLPYIAQSMVAFIAIPAAFMLQEPLRHDIKKKYSLKNIMAVIHYSMVKHKQLQRYILFSSVIGTATLTMAWFVQPYLKETGMPLPLFGITWTLLNATVGITAIFSYKMQHFAGQKKSFLLIALCIASGYFLAGGFIAIWGIVFLFFFYAVRGIATPLLKAYINTFADSNVRSTVLSVRSFIIRLSFSIIGPVLGWYTDRFSLQSALVLAGGIFLFLSMWVLISMFIRDSSRAG